MNNKVLLTMPVALATVTFLTGIFLTSTITHADGNTNVNDTLSITVNSACTMKGGPTGESTTDNTYQATIDPGAYSEISGSRLTTLCNDSEGYSIYAIGFSGDSYDTNNTKLLGQGTIAGTDINTGTSGTNSYWAMKLEAVQGLTPPTIETGWNDYHVIPDTYTQIAEYANSTASPSDAGASVQTKYKVNISSSQTAGSYQGKVKYTMVHPNDAPAPRPQPTPPTSCNTPVPNFTYMQDITPATKAAVLASLTEEAPYYIRDNRDEEPYCVSKLKDGNLWMLDNLRLDLTDSDDLNNLNPTNTNVDSISLISLRSGNRSAGNQYATSGIVKWESGDEDDSIFNQARINNDYKDTITVNYGAGSGEVGIFYNYCAASAGSYCYDGGAATGDASYDLCPANWRMPTGGASGEFQALYTIYSSNAPNFMNALSINLSGVFSGSVVNLGYVGATWASTYDAGYYSGYSMHYLQSRPGIIYPLHYSGRNSAFTIRCLVGA